MWLNPQETAELVTFTEEILMENFIFCAVPTRNFVKKFDSFMIFTIENTTRGWSVKFQ